MTPSANQILLSNSNRHLTSSSNVPTGVSNGPFWGKNMWFGAKIREITFCCFLLSTCGLPSSTVCHFQELIFSSVSRFVSLWSRRRRFLLRAHLERATLDVNVRNLKTSFCNLLSCARHLEHREGEEFPLVVRKVGQKQGLTHTPPITSLTTKITPQCTSSARA